MSNGYMKQDSLGAWKGVMRTLEHNISFHLKPRPSKTENEPIFEIFCNGDHGAEVKVGAVWEKNTKETGEIFYSLTFDDASFSKPIYVSAFKGKEPHTFDLVWQRPKQKQAA